MYRVTDIWTVFICYPRESQTMNFSKIGDNNLMPEEIKKNKA